MDPPTNQQIDVKTHPQGMELHAGDLADALAEEPFIVPDTAQVVSLHIQEINRRVGRGAENKAASTRGVNS